MSLTPTCGNSSSSIDSLGFAGRCWHHLRSRWGLCRTSGSWRFNAWLNWAQTWSLTGKRCWHACYLSILWLVTVFVPTRGRPFVLCTESCASHPCMRVNLGEKCHDLIRSCAWNLRSTRGIKQSAKRQKVVGTIVGIYSPMVIPWSIANRTFTPLAQRRSPKR